MTDPTNTDHTNTDHTNADSANADSADTDKPHFSNEDKLKIFTSLFAARQDVYARKWQTKTGKKGFSTVCDNEWRKSCGKPKIKCTACRNARRPSLDLSVIKAHLQGKIRVGVYPIFPSDECRFLAVVFDGVGWAEEAPAFAAAAKQFGHEVALQRCADGDGANAWIFFEDPVPARTVRRLGAKLLTYAMCGFEAYDNMLPNQDSAPRTGYGSAVELPLAGVPRQAGNGVFVNENFEPYPDQWEYLASVKRLDLYGLHRLIEVIPVDEPDVPAQHGTGEIKPRRDIELQPQDYPESVKMVLCEKLYIEKQGMGARLKYRLKQLATFANPEFFKAQAMRLSIYGKPRVISCAEECDTYISLPRGLYAQVRELLAPCRIISQDKRNAGSEINVEFNGTLRDNQAGAVEALFNHANGVLCATTAFGKTVAAVSLIAKRKVNTLILVHRAQLAEQWRERLEQFLTAGITSSSTSNNTSNNTSRNISSKTGNSGNTTAAATGNANAVITGAIGGGKNNLSGVIDVALLQSADRDFIKNYGMVIVDECHHVSAVTFEKVLKGVNAKFVYGLTATPKRADGHDPIITMQCGPVRYVATGGETHGFNRIIVPRYTAFCGSEGAVINQLFTELSQDAERNGMIIKDALAAYKKSRTAIILCNRKEHVKTLTDTLHGMGVRALMLVGGGTVRQRQEELDKLKAFPAGEAFIIVATGTYIGEGFDEPRLDTLLLAAPISWRGTLEQYVGRLHRKFDGKKDVIVLDYADINNKQLDKMWQNRQKGYAAIGYVPPQAQAQA